VSRLRYSPAAQIRTLQISRFSLFAFVEGREIDPTFFGRVCSSSCEPLGLRYQVRTAEELRIGHAGKASLIAFYRYALSRGKLRSTLNGKLSVLVFFLDKDVDDIRRTKCRSKHVIYTAHYDVQNYVFRHGNFIRSVSAASSIDENELSEHPLFGQNWHETAARRWKEWIVLCLFSVVHTKGQVSNYGHSSKVNSPQNGQLNPDLYNAQLLVARTASSFTELQFKSTIERLTRVVDRHLSRGTFDGVFKGKWYSTLLEMDLRAEFHGRGQLHRVGARATTALLATLDFTQPWAEHLIASTTALLVD
jgi:hypothetical protein